MRTRSIRLLTLVFTCLALIVPQHATGHRENEHAHRHEHHAPHGGTLVELGDHVMHVEFLLDGESGLLTAWILDAEAEKPVRVQQTHFGLLVQLPGEVAHTLRLRLDAVANPMTGESVGNSSEFRVKSSELVGVTAFVAEIDSLSARGLEFVSFEFAYPERTQ